MNARRRTGMTLMELVIGLAITGMMAAAGAGAFTSIIDHRNRIRDHARTTERAEAFREMLQSWIYAGTVQLQRGGGPRVGTAFSTRATTTAQSGGMNNMAASTPAQAAGDEIAFTTTALNPSLLGNVRIRLYVDADNNTPETGLCMEYQPNTQLPIVRKMLDSTIDTLKVEYLDSRTGKWYPSTETATITPIAVRLSLHSTDTTASPLLALPMTFVIPSSNNVRRIGQ